MTHIELPSPAVYVPVARGFLYKSLSLGFSYPSQSAYAALQDGRFMQELWDRVSLISYLQDMLPTRVESTLMVSADLRGCSFEEFKTRHVGAFGTAGPELPFPLNESRIREAGGDTLVEEIHESFERLGLSRRNQGITRGLPDHLSVELEFLQFLALKEFQAESQKDWEYATGYLQVQKHFIEWRLLKSFPGFFATFERSDRMPVLYSELVRITSEYVRRDSQWVTRRLENHQSRVEWKKSRRSSITKSKE
jgi:putative dimethyl sulfoxide reductase chaperone